MTKVALFAAFWPAAWQIARVTRPSSVLLFAGAYYGAYRFIVEPFGLQMMQNKLNDAARPLALKYGVLVESQL